MLARAIELKAAINKFVEEESELEHLLMTRSEWEQSSDLLKILYPFKLESTAIQSTTEPTIDRVYWAYERMFNALDETDTKLNVRKKKGTNYDWIEQLRTACRSMREKLTKYYTEADHFVFSEALLLDPTTKNMLFESKSFAVYDRNSKEQYVQKMRDRYEEQYLNMNVNDTDSTATGPTRKRKRHDDGLDDFKQSMLDSANTISFSDEFDRYIKSPRSGDNATPLLARWRTLRHDFPRLAMMARDVYAVPASSAGVEREFSKGGKVATASRGRLHQVTVEQTMMYKSYLARIGRSIDEGSEEMAKEDLELDSQTRKFLNTYDMETGNSNVERDD
jgi:hypothetical protein